MFSYLQWTRGGRWPPVTMCAMPEELTNAEQTQIASALPQELPKAKKIHLAAAIAQGESVTAWACNNGVDRSTAFRWAREPNVRRTVEACRRHTLRMPSRGGSIELLRRYVNVSDDDFRLLVVWLAAALRPVGPYPILVLYGEHGEDSPLTDILLELAPHRLDWIRTASELLAELTTWAGKRVTALPGWPKTPRSLSVALRRIAPQMRMLGVSIFFLRTPDKRFIQIISTKPPIPEEPHVSVGDIESCPNELIHADPDAAQVHPTA
jgi:hypothetical protein